MGKEMDQFRAAGREDAMRRSIDSMKWDACPLWKKCGKRSNKKGGKSNGVR